MHVEVDVSFGMPAFTMVGLPDASVRESRDRVRSAIRNSGFEFPPHRITVNLAPADVRKAGAVVRSADRARHPGGARASSSAGTFRTIVLLGELSLDGSIHATRGVLPIAAAARRDGLSAILLPASNAGEAAIVSGLDVLPRVVARRSRPRAQRSRRAPSSRGPVPPRRRAPDALPTWRTSADSCSRAARSKSPRPAATTCC